MLSGGLRKMRAEDADPVRYRLVLGEHEIPLAPLVGEPLAIVHSGTIRCVACGAVTRKSFSQGHCYRCFSRLASCDRCIVSPEHCHFHLGTCREPAWGETHCFQPHVVYLANSSGVKVGITRGTQVPTRWIDQGAAAAVPVLEVTSRRASGIVESTLKDRFADRTDWRAMLRGEPEPADLEALRDEVHARLPELEERLAEAGLEGAVRPVRGAAVRRFRYPVRAWPERVRSIDLAKAGRAEGVLEGVKGQYLILDAGVLNVRRHAGFEVSVEH